MKKIFEINNGIYPENIITQAISDFKEVADIIFNDNELEINWENETEINEIFNEFSNYLIWLINE